jgi:hypothetical protein
MTVDRRCEAGGSLVLSTAPLLPGGRDCFDSARLYALLATVGGCDLIGLFRFRPAPEARLET